jgi:transaldolase
MRLLVDGVDPEAVARWIGCGVARGVTTNSLILAGYAPAERHRIIGAVLDIAAPHPVSIQVMAVEEDAVIAEGLALARRAPNVVVKVPAIGPAGQPMLGAINHLSREGVPVNVTACLSPGQAIMAASAGAAFVSLLCGRIADEGGDPVGAVATTRHWIDTAEDGARIICGSVRTPGDVLRLLPGRPHFVTVPPAVLEKLADHRFARATVAEFLLAELG